MKLKSLVHILLMMTLILGAISCLKGQETRGRTLKSTVKKATSVVSNKSTVNLLDMLTTTGGVTIDNIIDPRTGYYESKVSIPKNFTGVLYLSGKGLDTIKDKLLKVRFKFGRNLYAVDAVAVIERGEGIIPDLDREVLAIHFNGRPFANLDLQYNLFDYTDYSATTTIVSDVRSQALYCRGLDVGYDPTFEGTLSNTLCDEAGEKCLYSYAKIGDATLYSFSSAYQEYFTTTPTSPQMTVTSTATTYADHIAQTPSILAKKCLPDSNDAGFLSALLGTTIASPVYNMDVVINSVTYKYKYRGPYISYAQSDWQIKDNAVFGTYGIFENSLTETLSGAKTPDGGYKSRLFPRYATRPLKGGIQYFGSATPLTATLALSSLSEAGTSNYMDGCNARLVDQSASNLDNISSCNVTALIEIVAVDASSGEETVIADTSAIKLQITHASATDSEGTDVATSALNYCSASSACGSSQCCYNNRCWPKTLVTRCLEEVSATGNKDVGATCSSDYQCKSLCCKNNYCAPHESSSTGKTCSKSIGDPCVGAEWCAMQPVTQYFIVKGVVNSTTGEQQCSLRAYSVLKFGQCRNGSCVAPTTPTVPTFDATKPACSNYSDAVDSDTASNSVVSGF